MGDSSPCKNSRLNELLDQVRAEFETQMRRSDGFEHDISTQISEMQLVRDEVYIMEQTHITLKQKYEADISMLRHQLQAARHSPPTPSILGSPSPSQPPSITSGNGLFSGVIAGSNQHGLQHQFSQGPPRLPGSPHLNAQRSQCQQSYPQGHTPPSGTGLNPHKATASSCPTGSHVDRLLTVVGPATPRINTTATYPANGSPQDSHLTSDHHLGLGSPTVGNFLCDLEVEAVAPHNKKTGSDWYAIFNPQVQRALDIDLVHSLDHESAVCCVRFSHDGKFVASGGNRSVHIFDVQTGETIATLEDHSAQDMTADLYIRSVCFSPDGRYLATGAEDNLIRVWDIESRTVRNCFSGHEQEIYSLDFARDGRTIASGSGDQTVRLWDIEADTNTLNLTVADGVTTVAISPDIRYVAAGSVDKSIYVWDIHAGFLVVHLEGPDGHKDSVYSVAFSPNGKDLISGSLDRTIKMWELTGPRDRPNTESKGGNCVKTFEGHRDFVLSVALTPDAHWVLSGSKDHSVQFWDPRTGTTQLLLHGHKSSVISVATSPQGGYFATGSGDMMVRIWSYRPY